MARIDNPRHSRPIDVHRWSEHPEVKALVDTIWESYLPEDITKAGPGPKPRTAFRKQLRVLILDLYVAWLDDPELSIGVSMSVNSWNTNSRYNAIHISKKIVPIIKALHAAGLLDMAKGSYAGPGARSNRTTRIRASEELQAMFREAKFIRDDVGRVEGEEIIILRDDKRKQVEYEDTDQTNAMREELKAYNALIQSSFIDISTLEEPKIQVHSDIEASLVTINADNARTHRVFSRSRWDMNGRFYGGWWQGISSDWRSRILIDDKPTVEVDFKALHVAMLYAKNNVQLFCDPYDLGRTIFPGYPRELERKITKQLVLMAINAKEKGAAYKAFRESFPADNVCKSMDNQTLDKYLNAFLKQNPQVADYLFSDQGIRLMHLDSRITERVHKHFTDQGVPVLSVHDSYIIDAMKVAEMREVMAQASEAVVGVELATSIKVPGLPEYSDVSDAQLQEHIDNRIGVRCKGYMERVFAYQERTGRSICPVASFEDAIY